MFRYIHLLLGPELIWLLLYLLISLVAGWNAPPAKGIDHFLENLFFYVPLAAALMFGLWWIPTVEKNWLLLRVWVAGVIGAHYVLDKGLMAHSKQGPGIGMVYIAGILFVFIVLVIGSVVIRSKF